MTFFATSGVKPTNTLRSGVRSSRAGVRDLEHQPLGLQLEGLSWSQIAERVCGDKRYKSRVGLWVKRDGAAAAVLD